MRPFGERRGSRRLGGDSLPDGVQVRVRPGHQMRVVNLSKAGVLVEGSIRLLPGRRVEVQLDWKGLHHQSSAVVLRCGISSLLPHGVLYRGALVMETGVPWLDASQAHGVEEGGDRGSARDGCARG